MKKFNKSNIIKSLELIIEYEIFNNNLKNSTEYTTFINNLRKFDGDINFLKDLDNIKGLTTKIKNYMRDLKKYNKIPYIEDIINKDDKFMSKNINKNIIIKNLEIIRDYEIYKNEVFKVKTYNTVILNLNSLNNDINDINDLYRIKGIGQSILKMITDLKYKGYIPYIKNIIEKDENYIKYLMNVIKKDKKEKKIPTQFDKKIIIKNLEIIRNYEIFNNNLDKGRAYINAIYNITHHDKEISNMQDLKDIKGVGKSISLLLNELKNTGKIKYIENIINKDKNYIDNVDTYIKSFNIEQLIKYLEIIKNYEIYNNEVYKVKAYNNAIENIIIYQDKLTSIDKFDNIEGIGTGILEKIYELYLTGKITYIENNIKNDKIYAFKQQLLDIYGIGPINAKKIVESGITNIEQLKKNMNILNDKQKIGLKYYNDIKQTIPLDEYNKHINIIKKDLTKSKLTFDFVGSYRRGSKNMGDIDLLIMKNANFNLKEYISKLIDENYIIDVLASGKNKFMGIVKIKNNPARRLDILIAPVDEYYYSLLYFTGSYLFNIGLRHYVKTKFNLSLSEHGFNKPISVKNEEDIFKFLNLKYVKPIDRNKFIQ
jgi:DNA polymerase/3'-5' exonuclease PolX